MTQEVAVVGVDISKAKFDVALMLADGEYRLAVFDNEASGFKRLECWLRGHHVKKVHVCLEATSRYGEGLAHYLWEGGHQVSLVNPARIKAYASSQLKRNKTDREDSKTIAHFCATQGPSLWEPPSASLRELQALTRHLEALKSMRQQERNRLKAGQSSGVVQAALANHLAFLESQIDELAEKIQVHIDQDPELSEQRALLVSIPGIGILTAAKFLAEVPQLERFAKACQLAAYAGLTPSHRQSGSSIWGQGRISKTGNARLRTLFFMPALQALRSNPIVQALAERMGKKGKKRKVIVVAAMRKLLHLAYGVLKTKQPFDPNFAVKSQSTT